MTSGSRTKATRTAKEEQDAERVRFMREEIEDLQEQITERQQELHARGVAVSPLIIDACKIETLIRWAAPSEHGRARFDMQVCKQVLAQMSDEVVDPVVEEKIEMAKAIAEAQRMAAEGRTQEGLYIPGTNEVLSVAAEGDATSPPTVAPPALRAVPGILGPPTPGDRS